ncbi:MAG: ABC transporter substrate-binding protein [Stellaceae bacterium]
MTKRILNESLRSARPTPARTSRKKAAALAAMLALATIGYQGSAYASSAGETVQGLYNTLIDTMKGGTALGSNGRYLQLAPVIRSSFDLPFMARLAFGPGWSALTPAQQQQVAQSYGRYISAVYADRFDSYHGQRLDVTGQHQNPYGLIVTSQIIKADGEPVEVDYLMRQSSGQWLIADIYLDGTISEVATHRSEFAAILRDQGVDGLIEALNRKAEMLTSSAAGAG